MAGERTDEELWELWEHVRSYSRWRARKEEIENDLLGRLPNSENIISKRFDDGAQSDQNHNDLLRSTITAFGPSSRIFDELGWRLLCAEPLYEKNPSLRNPDALIGHPDRDTAVLVECKAGLSSPQKALQQIHQAATTVMEHREYLNRKTGIPFQEVESVLCVPGEVNWKAVEAIEQAEDTGEPPTRILLWNLNRFDEERLQLHTKVDNRTVAESNHDSKLSEILSGNGVEVAEDPMMSPLFFPESHPYNIMEQCFSELLWARTGGEDSIRQFTRTELFELMDDQKHVPHYDTQTIAENTCNSLLDRLKEYNLIVQKDPSEEGMGRHVELYTYNEHSVSGRTMDTILKNLKESFREEWIARRAEREAVSQTLDEFEDESGTFDNSNQWGPPD